MDFHDLCGEDEVLDGIGVQGVAAGDEMGRHVDVGARMGAHLQF